MTLIGSIMDKVMKRGLYKAYVNDRLISQCKDCRHNLTEHNPIPGFRSAVRVHRCEMDWNLDGTNKVLIDPYGIPAWCPFKIKELEEVATAQ